MNCIALSGKIVRDCEVKDFGSIKLIFFSVANDDIREKKNNKWVNHTSFIDVKFFSKSGNMASHLLKGVSVNVQGKIKQERWEKDNKTNSRICVYADSVQPWTWQKKLENNVAAQEVIPF